MRLRILMTGNNESYLATEKNTLKEKGFTVYTTTKKELLKDLIAEVQPDLLFLNFQQPGDSDIALYHSVLDDIKIAGLPVVFTLSEHDVYLVNRKRTISREKRNITAHDIVRAIKLAFTNTKMVIPHLPFHTKHKGGSSFHPASA